MSKSLDVGIRITADGRVLVSETAAAKAALAGLAETAKKAGAESASMGQQQDRQAASSRNATTAAKEQKSALDSIKDALVKGAGAYLTYQAAMAGGRAIIDTALANERLNNTLKVATGSTEAAARETQFLRQESEKLGLQFVSTADQYAKLAAAAKGTTLEGQATRDIFLAVAKASTVLGMSSEQSGGALLALQQMISKGKVSAEELNGQLGERLPGALQIAARALDMTTAELQDMMQKGNLTAEKLLPALAAELEKTFGAQAQEAAQGLNAKINRLDNSFTDLKTAIGNTGLIDLLSNGIVLATRFVDALSGAKVLSAVDAQKQKISEMRAELESLGNRKHIPLIGDLLFDKKQADLLSQRIDDGIQDLQKLEKTAQEAAESMSGKKTVTPGSKPDLPKELADELEKQAKERKRAAESAARETERAIESSQKYAAALQLETDQIGKTIAQKKLLAAATEAAKAPTKELAMEIMASAQAFALAADKEEALKQAEKDRLETVREVEKAEKEAAKASEESARKAAQQWNHTWSSVEQTAKTSFIQFAAHGKSAMQSIGESIKLSIIDVLYQLTVRKWIINIGASLQGSFLNSAGSAVSGGSGIGNLLNIGSIGSNLSSGIKSGFGLSSLLSGGTAGRFSNLGGAGTAFIGGPGTALGGSGLGGLSSLGSSFGAAAGPVMAAFAVDAIGRALAGDKKLGGAEMIPVLGGFLAAAFGRGPRKFRQEVAIGDVSAEGFDGRFTRVDRAKGGLLVGNKHWEYDSPDSAAFQQAFDTAIKGYAASAQDFAKNLGLSADAVTGYSKAIRLESEKGKALTEEQISSFLRGIGNEFAQGIMPTVDTLKKAGEDSLATLGRLSTEFTTLSDAATILGKSVAESRAFISGTSFEGRSAFVENAGGIDALNQKAAFFSQNFLTESARLAPTQEKLNDELKRLGLSTNLTKDQFRDLVQSFGKINGVSEETLQSLLTLAPAFVTVRDAAESAKRESLNGAYATLQKSVETERNRITNDYNAAVEISNKRIQGVTESIGKFKTLSEALKSTVDAIRPLGRDQAKQQIRDAINTARAGGELPQADSLRSALSVLGNSQTISANAGSFEFAREQAKTANLVAELGSVTDSQLLLDERSLAALEDSRKRLDQGFNDEMGRLDSLLSQGQAQIDALNGINTSILSLSGAVGGFNAASIAAGGNSIGVTASGISYKDIRDFSAAHTPDEIYAAAQKYRVSSADIAASGAFTADEIAGYLKSKGLPKFASGGYHSGGLRIVGERGPEIEATGPSRITSNNDLSKMLSNDDVVEKLLMLITEIQTNNKYNQRVASKLDAVTVQTPNGKIALRTGT